MRQGIAYLGLSIRQFVMPLQNYSAVFDLPHYLYANFASGEGSRMHFRHRFISKCNFSIGFLSFNRYLEIQFEALFGIVNVNFKTNTDKLLFQLYSSLTRHRLISLVLVSCALDFHR